MNRKPASQDEAKAQDELRAEIKLLKSKIPNAWYDEAQKEMDWRIRLAHEKLAVENSLSKMQGRLAECESVLDAVYQELGKHPYSNVITPRTYSRIMNVLSGQTPAPIAEPDPRAHNHLYGTCAKCAPSAWPSWTARAVIGIIVLGVLLAALL